MFVLQLALIGVCVALLPLAYVWVNADTDKFRKLVWITTFLTLDLVMFGSFTRLTDSGLGCPDWPGCYGTASPFAAHAAIHAAQQVLPSGPVTVAKAWIEMIHRYFAMAIGVLIIAQVLLAWVKRARPGQPHPGRASEPEGGAAHQALRPAPGSGPPAGPHPGLDRGSNRSLDRGLHQGLQFSPWWPTALLALVCLQGAFGAWTVTHKLEPVIVTTHLLLGLALLCGLGLFAARLGPAPEPDPAAARWQWAALAGLALLILQVALGGWVSTNYAVLACTDFPLCNGHWIPPMDFAHGFHLWRALGKTGGGELLGQDALVAIHWTHRTFAVVVIAYLCWLWTRLARVPALRKLANALLAVLLLQFATGLSNIVLQWPLPVAVAHNGGAAVLLLILVMLNFQIASRRSRSHRARSAGA